jgi:hypothetical protein
MASAFFFSTSAGDNDVFGNDIYIHQENPGTDAEAFAFYIGNARGGKLYNNRITSNVTPIWVGCSYGRATDIKLSNNQITKAPNTLTDFKPVRMGSLEQPDYLAENIEFCSNELIGLEFGVNYTDQHHSYSVYWTLAIKVVNKAGQPINDTEIRILDKSKKEIIHQKTGNEGILKVELLDYAVDGVEKTSHSPYTVIAGKKKMEVELNINSEITLITK